MTKCDVFRTVKRNIVEVLFDVPEDRIAIEMQLKELGANSVDRMEIVTKSMEDLGINVPMVEFAKAKNIEGLVNILYESLSS